jgi:ferredoxin
MKATVDQAKCIGCGLCASTCGSVFKMSEETQKSTVIPGANCDSAGCCKEAAANCPATAIKIIE